MIKKSSSLPNLSTDEIIDLEIALILLDGIGISIIDEKPQV